MKDVRSAVLLSPTKSTTRLTVDSLSLSFDRGSIFLLLNLIVWCLWCSVGRRPQYLKMLQMYKLSLGQKRINCWQKGENGEFVGFFWFISCHLGYPKRLGSSRGFFQFFLPFISMCLLIFFLSSFSFRVHAAPSVWRSGWTAQFSADANML